MNPVQYRTRKGSLLSEEDLINESEILGIPVEELISRYGLSEEIVQESNVEKYSDLKPENTIDPGARYITFKRNGKQQTVYEDDYKSNWAGKKAKNGQIFPLKFDDYAKKFNTKPIVAPEVLDEVVISAEKKENTPSDLANKYINSQEAITQDTTQAI